ncbi:MAG: hypothetical protein ACTSXT_08155 [Candidatus Helarchaeota archaeon]
MNRPKKLMRKGRFSSLSTYEQYMDGFNTCKKKYDTFIPTKKEWIEFFRKNKISKAKLIADLVYRKLK